MPPRISSRSPGRSSSLTLCALAALAAALAPVRIAAACAWGDDCQDIQCNSMFSPEIIGDPAAKPFFYSDVGFSLQNRDMVEEYRNSLEAANLDEWAAYFDARISTGDLSFLLYKMKVPDLDELIFSLQGRSAAPSARAKALLEPLSTSKRAAVKALYYLGFAKRVEPIATWRDERKEWESKDSVSASSEVVVRAAGLIEGSRALLKNVPDPFLEQRYHFQVMRLLFYSDKYEECLAYYEAHKSAFETAGSVKYRAMDLAAGSLYRRKDYSKADYLYSRIFDLYAPLRESAFRSFHPQEESDWRQTLAMAHGVRETTILWQMFGLYADGVTAIEEIYSLDPKSKRLPLLLVHEVNKAEADARLTAGRSRTNDSTEPITRVSPALLAVVRKIADAGGADEPEVWNAALGHLLAMDGDLKAAEARLDLVKKSAGDDSPLGVQARMSRLFAAIRRLSAPSRDSESYFAREFVWLATAPNPRTKFLLDWGLNALSLAYEKNRDRVRSKMLADDPTADLYQDNAAVDEFIAFLQKSGKGDFDRFLVDHYGYSIDQLIELQVINDLYSGRFKEAAQTHRKVAGPEPEFAADPFSIHINDCHDCDFEAPNKTRYTKAAFFRKLDELERRAGGTGEDAARASFELANALYNITWFGNARDAYATPHDNFPANLARNLDMGPAEKYYARAIALSGNREFKAKAAFMAAKSEHNALYAAFAGQDPLYYGLENYFDKKGIPAGRYYELLKGSYSDTRYYSEILAECGYFRRWAQGK